MGITGVLGMVQSGSSVNRTHNGVSRSRFQGGVLSQFGLLPGVLFGVWWDGVPSRIRTDSLHVRSVVLSPFSYRDG